MFEFVPEFTGVIAAKGEDIEWYGPASEGDIKVVEARLNLTIPDQFRAFLMTYGGGGLGQSPISGIIPGAPLTAYTGTILFDTEYCRKRYDLPDDFIVINAEFDEVYWCLDMSPEPARVVSYDIFTKTVFSKAIAESFRDFLYEQLEMEAYPERYFNAEELKAMGLV